MIRAFGRLAWRLIPVVILLVALRGSAGQYGQYFAMLKNASKYSATYTSLSQYVTALERHYAEHGTLPSDLGDFLRTNFTSKKNDPAVDQWGTPYNADDGDPQFTVFSCGADRACRTEDDLSASGTKPSRSGGAD